MCRMIAALSSKPLRSESLKPFEILAAKGKIRSDMTEPGHCDGWGMTAYLKEDVPEYIERQPTALPGDSDLFHKALQWMETSGVRNAMIHLRKSTEGAKSISNTHPFLHGRWSFCHNGTIYDSGRIPLQKLATSGTTDSERFFLYLMENLSRFLPAEWSLRKSIARVKKMVSYSSLTFLLSDGSKLYAYRDCDPRFEEYYTLYSSRTPDGQFVCSEPLPSVSRAWESLPNGTLITLR